MTQREQIISKVMKMMKWSLEKAEQWYFSRNPMLGGASPERLVTMGRGYKVLKYVEAAEKENSRD